MFKSTLTMKAKKVIDKLGMKPHDEGGYCVQTHQSAWTLRTNTKEERYGFNAIYYLIAKDQPLLRLHKNKSDILTFYHCGGALEYILISPQGEISYSILGKDLSAGQMPQLKLPSGYWRGAFLQSGDYALVSECVVPGFDYRDRKLAEKEDIEHYPNTVVKTACAYIPCWD